MPEVGVLLGAVELDADRAELGVVPGGGVEVRALPQDVGDAVAVAVLAEKELPPPEDRAATGECDGGPDEVQDVGVALRLAPVEPRQLVVLAVRVVVAALRAVELVAAQDQAIARACSSTWRRSRLTGGRRR